MNRETVGQLPPACMKCEAVTGKNTCFPGPCVFFHERDTPGTKAYNIAMIDRTRWGMRDTVHATAECDCGIGDQSDIGHYHESWCPTLRAGGSTPAINAELRRPVSEVRKQAWETRRAKYGARGHCGSYTR